jgi:hypothetical protein
VQKIAVVEARVRPIEFPTNSNHLIASKSFGGELHVENSARGVMQ